MPEAEHPEQHPGADRPCGRLAGEPGAAAGVDPERREQRDLPEHPGEQEEALDTHGLADERLAEHGVDVDGGEMQAGRHGRAEEERRAARARPRPRRRAASDADGAAQAGSIPAGVVRRRVELAVVGQRAVADRGRGVRVAIGEQEEVGVRPAPSSGG